MTITDAGSPIYYRAVITLDFVKQDPNRYQQLIAALLDLGWDYAGTSAVAVETDEIARIMAALDVVARRAPSCGADVNSITFQMQRIVEGKDYVGADKFRGKAVEVIMGEPAPGQGFI